MIKNTIEYKALIEECNKCGYVVRDVQDYKSNKFGDNNIVVIEGGQYRITYTTNVLHGRNYYKVISIYDYLNERNYVSERYHHKFIPLLSWINGNTYISLNGRTE